MQENENRRADFSQHRWWQKPSTPSMALPLNIAYPTDHA
jgi:hypothetical protein